MIMASNLLFQSYKNVREAGEMQLFISLMNRKKQKTRTGLLKVKLCSKTAQKTFGH